MAGADGELLARAVGGCTDIYGARSVDEALAELERVVRECLRLAVVDRAKVGRGVFCLAGADWPEDIALLREFVCERRLAARATVFNDAFGALRAGNADFVGVSIVCGTGAATGARAPGGALWHSSWWQEPQGARQLGRLALRAVYRSSLEIEEPTSMTEYMLRAYKADSVEDLLHSLTARGRGRSSTEPAAQVLTSAAEAGDQLAVRLLRAHGAQLAAIGIASSRRVGLQPGQFPVVLAGSVLHASSVLRSSVTGALAEVVPSDQVRLARLSPAAGALLLAFDEEGLSAGEKPPRWEAGDRSLRAT